MFDLFPTRGIVTIAGKTQAGTSSLVLQYCVSAGPKNSILYFDADAGIDSLMTRQFRVISKSETVDRKAVEDWALSHDESANFCWLATSYDTTKFEILPLYDIIVVDSFNVFSHSAQVDAASLGDSYARITHERSVLKLLQSKCRLLVVTYHLKARANSAYADTLPRHILELSEYAALLERDTTYSGDLITLKTRGNYFKHKLRFDYASLSFFEELREQTQHS